MKTFISFLLISGIVITRGFALPGDLTLAGTPPVAYDITMPTIVQASPLLPLSANGPDAAISSYMIETIPADSQGVLSLNMNGLPVPVSAGTMLTADLAGSLSFEPNPSFTGTAIFTYSANDENGSQSNTATYSIPVIAKQGGILPVELLQFSGQAAGRNVQLWWETQNEDNSSYFELQRSNDGTQFETIATVTAKRLTGINQYKYADDLFLHRFTTVRYRLKMVNLNGSYKISNTITIQLDEAVKQPVKVWPLPFSNELNIAYSSTINENITVSVVSMSGATITRYTEKVKQGRNLLRLNQASYMPAGTYALIISSSTGMQTIKVTRN